jgi:hypothetical protein
MNTFTVFWTFGGMDKSAVVATEDAAKNVVKALSACHLYTNVRYEENAPPSRDDSSWNVVEAPDCDGGYC